MSSTIIDIKKLLLHTYTLIHQLYTNHLFQVLRGNSNTYLVEKQKLDLPFVASKVRFVPYSQHPRTVCMRVEIYGCIWERKHFYYIFYLQEIILSRILSRIYHVHDYRLVSRVCRELQYSQRINSWSWRKKYRRFIV